MADSLLIDLDVDGTMRVSVLRDGDLPSPVSGELPVVRWPLDAAELEDLRWYLEQYLALPYAVYEERGARIAAGLSDWGHRVFDCIFAAGPTRDALLELRGSGRPIEVVFRSTVPGALGLPWELMQDPARPAPMALDGVRISRSLPTSGTGQSFAVDGERLRVLMVISRPSGTSDVAYQMIARPLVSRLAAVRGTVELVVLRPPTLAALQAELARAKAADEPYQIVHFDGHGALSGRSAAAPGAFGGRAESGIVVFEKPEGGPDHVDAATFAKVLADAQIPVVVLNACQSGAVGKELEATVATRLLAHGARAVVAMAYSVYATAAAEFMTAFYERLFAGDLLSDAVAAGRAQMAQRNLRHSPKGLLPLQDWLIPVHYKRSDVSFPKLVTTHTPTKSLDDLLNAALDGELASAVEQDPLAPTEQFVGRDDLFYRIEKALWHRRGAVLHGPGGTGKTELAKAFGRWAADTGGVGRPEWVVWHSFEPGVATFGLDGVVDAIGRHLFDTRFLALGPGQRLNAVVQALAENRVLLIWDNFESVASMPDPNEPTPPLPEAEKQRLARFLKQVTTRAGRSSAILTSRTTEDWLDPNLVRLDMGGLTPDEAIKYANNLLAPLPVPQRHRDTRYFADLLDWLDGHPLSMRLTLPHLAARSPREILDSLTGHTDDLLTDDLDTQVDRKTRATSLTASIAYSYRHLSVSTQRRLTALSLLQGVADKSVLGVFSDIDGVPERFRSISAEAWKATLDEASGVGLLTPLGLGMYRIHPALPAYLSALWRDGADTDYAAERVAADTSLLHAYAAFSQWLTQQIKAGDASLAYALIGAQKGTFNRVLTLALTKDDFTAAGDILQPLHHFGKRQGHHAEWDAWTDRVRLATETAAGEPPSLNTDAGQLWRMVVFNQAIHMVSAGHLRQAQAALQTILDMLQKQPATDAVRRDMATSCHQFGIIAQERGQLDDAKQWYRHALTINEELNNRPGTANSYHQLGILAELQGHLDEAEQWHRQSLTIRKELGDRPGIATSYHQLGIVALLQDHLDEADQWYRQSLTVMEELGDRPGKAASCHQLGRIAQERGNLDQAEHWYRQALTINEELNNRPGKAITYNQLSILSILRHHLDEAEQWCRQALTIREELGDRPGTANSYHQLGILAQERGHLDQAEHWYRQSLTIEEELGNRRGMAVTYGQLGLLAEDSRNLSSALQWTVCAVALFEEFPEPMTGPAPHHLVRLTAALGEPALARAWQRATGQALPEQVRTFVADAIRASQHEPSNERKVRK